MSTSSSVPSNAISAAGAATTSDCFVAALHLPHRDALGEMTGPHSVSWIRRRQYGNSAVNEFCSDLTVVGRKSSDRGTGAGSIWAVGHSYEGGLLTSLRPYGSHRRQVYGTLLDLDSGMEMQGGVLLHSNRIQFPVAIATDRETGHVFVAEVFSDMDSLPSEVRDMLSTTDQSATGYGLPVPEGGRYSVRLKQMKPRQGSSTTASERNGTGSSQEKGAASLVDDTFASGWSREFGTVDMDDVRVSSISYHHASSTILLTGFTAGTGSAFGEANNSTGPGDLDGFLTTLDPETGYVVDVLRIDSLLMAGNDRILSVCYQESHLDVSYNSSYVYLAGYTDGLFDATSLVAGDASRGNTMYAFLLKVDLATMEVKWNRQIGGSPIGDGIETVNQGPQLHGMSCCVTPDGNEVYLAGNVMNGTSLSDLNSTDDNSLGLGDIFVAKFTAAEGQLVYSRQIGTPERDSLARGKSLATDAGGNLIVMGNTEGSMYRSKIPNGSSDIVVFSVSRENGNYMFPHFKLPDEDETSTNMPGGETSTTTSGGESQATTSSETSQENRKNLLVGAKCFLYVMLVSVICAIGAFVARRRHREKSVIKWNDSKRSVIGKVCTLEDPMNMGILRLSPPQMVANYDEDTLLARLSRDRQYRIQVLKKLTRDRQYQMSGTSNADTTSTSSTSGSVRNTTTATERYPTTIYGIPVYRDKVDVETDDERGSFPRDMYDPLSGSSKRLSLEDIHKSISTFKRDDADQDSLFTDGSSSLELL